MRQGTSNTTARFGVMYVMAMFRNELIVCGCQCFGSVYHFLFVDLALKNATERIRLEHLLLQNVYGTNTSTTMIIILSATVEHLRNEYVLNMCYYRTSTERIRLQQ